MALPFGFRCRARTEMVALHDDLDPAVEAFDRAVSPLFARIQANSYESRTLASLRDTLLYRAQPRPDRFRIVTSDTHHPKTRFLHILYRTITT